MNDINNPHDKFFKKIFESVQEAVSFVAYYLPAKVNAIINTQSLEITSDSFVDEELKEFHSDMVYKVNMKSRKGYLYLLLDHKSYPEPYVSFYLERYIHKIWAKEMENKTRKNERIKMSDSRLRKLPFVFPIVLYHGRTKWNVGQKLSDIIDIPNEE